MIGCSAFHMGIGNFDISVLMRKFQMGLTPKVTSSLWHGGEC